MPSSPNTSNIELGPPRDPSLEVSRPLFLRERIKLRSSLNANWQPKTGLTFGFFFFRPLARFLRFRSSRAFSQLTYLFPLPGPSVEPPFGLRLFAPPLFRRVFR